MYVMMALLPILTALVLMMGFKVKPGKSMLTAWIVTAISGFFFWKMDPLVIFAASLTGVCKALDIVLIIFGAVLLLNTQRKQKALRAINLTFRDLSPDRRIQILLIAWLFSGLLEGAAGFGAAPPIVASFLVGLGFPALTSVAIALMGNTLPVPFGGVGIPTMTLQRTLETDLAQHNIAAEQFHSQFLDTFTAISGISGLLIPFGCVVMMILLSKQGRKLRSILEILPLSLAAGLFYIIPWRITAMKIGTELPSIAGVVIGLPLFVFILKTKWLTPKYIWDFPENELSAPSETADEDKSSIPAWKAWMPYLILTLLLLLTRLDQLPFRQWLIKYGAIHIKSLFGLPHTAITFNLLNNPGFFPFCFIAGYLICRNTKETWKERLQIIPSTCKQLSGAAFAIIMAFAMVQLMIYSNYVDPQLPGMLNCIAVKLTELMGGCYLIAAQFLGVFGSFFGGSCTVSNILFASLQFNSAQILKIPADVVLALQNTGSGLGGMIRISGVIAACAAVKIDKKTGDVLLLNLIPLVVFSILALLTALFFC